MSDRAGSPTTEPERLPIKLILPKQGRERAVPHGGPKALPFRTVDSAFRNSLGRQVRAAQAIVSISRAGDGSVPIRAKLLPKAVAKSHRPEHLFSERTCPIIGAGQLGELFLKATTAGMERLARIIETDTGAIMTKEISSVDSIAPITPLMRRGEMSPAEIMVNSPKVADKYITRVRLFQFGEQSQSTIVKAFLESCSIRDLAVQRGAYFESSFTYAVGCRTTEDVDFLSNDVSVRSVRPMPLLVMPPMSGVKAKGPESIPPVGGDATDDFPVVVVVDSGISSMIPSLAPWIRGRESYVAPEYQNTRHGTFVAGLVCWGGQLNPGLAGIDDNPCGVFDVQVLPNDDPGTGDIDNLSESEFLLSLEASLKVNANKYKVWNLSLSSNEVCSLHEFSSLAEQLDNLQEKYQVSFVISSGNYATPPLLSYPRLESEMDRGRITSPADSVLGITVGSIAHTDCGSDTKDRPSAFSRHGAGPNHVIKPDLVHYGGACSLDLSLVEGVHSVGEQGGYSALGTSFATPLVSRTLAQIYHAITPTPSPVLARGLIVHGARDPRSGGRGPDSEVNFLGFGRPSPAPVCLECTAYSSTLVFEDVLRHGHFLEWDDFPFPSGLHRNGKYFGEIWMTVAFAPARGARWGTEYCETHIEAHLGVFKKHKTRKTGKVTEAFKGLVPPEHRNKGELFESFQVKELRKWAPVRTYYGNLGSTGETGSRWRLMVRLLTRHGIDDTESFGSQPFSLIVTIADPERKVPVYDEMAQMIHNRYQAQNLSLRPGTRVRTMA
jgi:serine protease AprX